MLPDSGVAAVGQRARLLAAQPSNVVLVTTERVLASPAKGYTQVMELDSARIIIHVDT